MANPQLQLNHPTSMTKRGLSPEETKEIVSSKAIRYFESYLQDKMLILIESETEKRLFPNAYLIP
jgi:hypothetical protein